MRKTLNSNNPNAKGVTPDGLKPRVWDRRKENSIFNKRSFISRKMKEQHRSKINKPQKRMRKKHIPSWLRLIQTNT